MFRYPVIIEKARGNYSAYCPDLPGCIAAGKTIPDTLRKIREAIQFHFEGMKKEGLPIPKPAIHVEYIEVSIST
jgi:predicted RNase H-like HicB family nuclease